MMGVTASRVSQGCAYRWSRCTARLQPDARPAVAMPLAAGWPRSELVVLLVGLVVLVFGFFRAEESAKRQAVYLGMPQRPRLLAALTAVNRLVCAGFFAVAVYFVIVGGYLA